MRLAWRGVLEVDSKYIFSLIWVADNSLNGSYHVHIPFLQTFEQQLLGWDWLPIRSVRVMLILCNRLTQNQDVLKEEHVKFVSVFILQLPAAQQHFTCFNSRSFCFLSNLLQLTDAILVLEFTFLQVDIREKSLYYPWCFLQKLNIRVVFWSVPGLASNYEPPNLCLLSSWDYRCEPLYLA
jgi:hypothetical protein